MNTQDLKNTWQLSTKNKVNISFSILIGLFFLFSLSTKLFDIKSWLNFNYELVQNDFGYVNGISILIIELFFSVSFLVLRINKLKLIVCFLFILFLTIFVLSNKELFKTCMCFGSFIPVKPDLSFVIKNSSLLLSILIVYLSDNSIKM
jgi:hypothetical protein